MILLWDTKTHQQIGAFKGHTEWVNRVLFTSDGKTLISASDDNTIRFWNVAQRKEIDTLKDLSADSEYGVNDIALSPDQTRLAIGLPDGTIKLLELSTRKQIGTPFSQAGAIYDLTFSPNGKTLASAGQDNSIVLWDVETQQAIGDALDGHQQSIRGVVYSPDGKFLASASEDGTFVVWNTSTDQIINQQPHDQTTEAVNSVVFSPNGQIIAAGSDDGTIMLWNSINERVSTELAGYPGTIRSVAFSTNGNMIAAGGCALSNKDGECRDGPIWLWDAGTGHRIEPVLKGNTGSARSIAFIPNGQFLASDSCAEYNEQNVCTASQILIWDVASHQLLKRVRIDAAGAINCVALSPDGKFLAAGADGGQIYLWRTATYEPIGTALTGHTGSVRSLAFSPDSKLLVSGSDDQTIMLWDVGTQQRNGPPLTGHTDTVRSVVFNPSGTMLASGSDDGTIILWDVATRQKIGPSLTGAYSNVRSIAFNPNGKTLAAGTDKPDITLWDVDIQSWQANACALAGRNMRWEEWKQYLPDQPYRATCPNTKLYLAEALKQADTFAQAGVSGAAQAFKQAEETALSTPIAALNTETCRLGSIDGFAQLVLPACEQGVKLTPDSGKGRSQSIRGIALALIGERQRAIDDFTAFIEWAKTRSGYDRQVRQHESWINELKAGRNPFNSTMVEMLRNAGT